MLVVVIGGEALKTDLIEGLSACHLSWTEVPKVHHNAEYAVHKCIDACTLTHPHIVILVWMQSCVQVFCVSLAILNTESQVALLAFMTG